MKLISLLAPIPFLVVARFAILAVAFGPLFLAILAARHLYAVHGLTPDVVALAIYGTYGANRMGDILNDWLVYHWKRAADWNARRIDEAIKDDEGV